MMDDYGTSGLEITKNLYSELYKGNNQFKILLGYWI